LTSSEPLTRASARVSIVVPTRNGRSLLEEALDGLRRQTFRDFETIVVDNASSDGSAEFVRARYPGVVVVQLAENRGFAAAVNAGIRVAGGDAIALLNNDAIGEPDWLDALCACLGRHPQAAAATSKLLTYRDRTEIDGAGDILTTFLRAYSRGRGHRDLGQFELETEVFGASGAASLWRRSALHEIGPLDEDLFAYYEDVDLSFRARLLGYQIWYAPKAVVVHRGGATAVADRASFVHYHAVLNRWSVLIKNVPTSVLLACGPRATFAELLSLARATREGHLRLMGRAYLHVLRALPRWIEIRRTRQRGRRVGGGVIQGALTPGYPDLRRRTAQVVLGARRD
jgi:GT2 family glycosyltransferase